MVFLVEPMPVIYTHLYIVSCLFRLELNKAPVIDVVPDLPSPDTIIVLFDSICSESLRILIPLFNIIL